jgi:O-antigen ligase
MTIARPQFGNLGDDIAAVVLLSAFLLPLGLAASDASRIVLLFGFSLGVGLVLVALFTAQGRLPGLAGRIAICMLPYASVLATRGGYFHLGYMLAIALVILLGASARYAEGFWRLTMLVVALFSTIYLALWISEGMPLQFQAWMINKNWLGIQLFFMTVASVGAMRYLREPLERLFCLAVISALALLLFASSSRASTLAAAVFLVTYFIWPILVRRRWILKSVFIFTLILSAAIIPFYIALSISPFAARLDEWSVSTTGQTFFSGRQIVWSVYILLISSAPWLGHGFAFDKIIDTALLEGLPEHYAGLSAHNLYLMISVQTGVVGLLTFGLFVVGIWNLLARNPGNRAFRLAGPAFLAFLVHEIFEVTLVQNNLLGAWPMWLLIGFALRESQSECAEQR